MKILVVDHKRDVHILFEQRFRKEIRSGALTFEFAFLGENAGADDFLTKPIEFNLLKEK